MRIAVYAGTFDPVTLGHLSVIKRAVQIFDRLVVLVAVNPDKDPLFSESERVAMIRELVRPLPGVLCRSSRDYVVHVAKNVGAKHLVRGVRGATDVASEIALAHLNLQLAPDITTVFIPAEPSLSKVSSSRLKQMVASGQNVTRYCPLGVADRLAEKLSARKQADHVAA